MMAARIIEEISFSSVLGDIRRASARSDGAEIRASPAAGSRQVTRWGVYEIDSPRPALWEKQTRVSG